MDVMEQAEFQAFVVEEQDGAFVGGVKSRLVSELPQGDLLIEVHYSSLNYKIDLILKGELKGRTLLSLK
jgi:hypothetical protein